MDVPSRNCQFFGALTYGVIIGLRSLSGDEAETLHQELLTKLNQFITTQQAVVANALVIRKLLLNISMLFVKNSHLRPVDGIAHVMGRCINSLETFDKVLVQLPQHLLEVLVNFFSIVVEDISKTNESTGTDIHATVHLHIYPSYQTLLGYFGALITSDQLPQSLHIATLESMVSWVLYISMAETSSTTRYTDLVFVDFVMLLFRAPTSEESISVASKGLSVLLEMVEVNPRMLSVTLRTNLMALLFNEDRWGMHFIRNIVFTQSDEFREDIESFVNFVVAFLQADIMKLSKRLLVPEFQRVLMVLLQLTDIPGTAIEDEGISEVLLTFWEELGCIYVDDEDTFSALFEDQPEEAARFDRQRNDIFKQVCLVYWRKVHLPEPSVLKGIRSEFGHYRQNVADFFINVYLLMGISLIEDLTNSLVSGLTQQSSLTDIESTLFLLSKITEDAAFYQSQCEALVPFVESILKHGLLPRVRALSSLDGANISAHSSLINFLSSVQFFLRTDAGKPYLGDILDFLFSIVLNTGSDKALATLSLISSRTILKLCQECRANLVEFLPTLQVLLEQFLRDKNVDHLIRQRMFNAYTSIAQCIKDPVEFAQILHHTLSTLFEHTTGIMAKLSLVPEPTEDYLVSLLASAHEIGKGCQLPDEPDEIYTPQQQTAVSEYWARDPLGVKPLVYSIVAQFSLEFSPFQTNSLVTEKCCSILKCGLGEPLDGPFCFPLDLIFDYMVKKVDQANPDSISHIYSLGETVINTNFRRLNNTVVSQLLGQIFTAKLDLIRSDPDLIKASLDLVTLILEKRPSLILHSQVFLDEIVHFAVTGFKADEVFIIKAVLRFWVAFLSLKKGSQADHAAAHNLLSSEQFVYSIVTNLMVSFLSTSRSSLEYYYPVFRQFVGKHPLIFKRTLTAVLAQPTFNNAAYLDGFVDKLMLTRGQRSSHEILKKLWLGANGLIDYST